MVLCSVYDNHGNCLYIETGCINGFGSDGRCLDDSSECNLEKKSLDDLHEILRVTLLQVIEQAIFKSVTEETPTPFVLNHELPLPRSWFGDVFQFEGKSYVTLREAFQSVPPDYELLFGVSSSFSDTDCIQKFRPVLYPKTKKGIAISCRTSEGERLGCVACLDNSDGTQMCVDRKTAEKFCNFSIGKGLASSYDAEKGCVCVGKYSGFACQIPPEASLSSSLPEPQPRRIEQGRWLMLVWIAIAFGFLCIWVVWPLRKDREMDTTKRKGGGSSSSKSIPDEHKNRIVRFFQAKNCNAVHVPINPGYDNFYRALATSAFSVLSGVNLGYGAPTSGLKGAGAGPGEGKKETRSRADTIKRALSAQSTPSHYVQIALAAHIRAYCERAVSASRGGLREITLRDIVPSERGRAAKTAAQVEELLLSPPSSRGSAAIDLHPRGLFEYLSKWYGVMAAQSLAGADIPSDLLSRSMNGMRALLQGTSDPAGPAGSGDDADELEELIVNGMCEGAVWPRGPRDAELWRRGAETISQVAKLIGFPAGLCIVHPYPKSKFELYGPNTTWCTKQDRRRYSIREEDRASEDKLAMMPLPSDIVEDGAEISAWLPLLGIAARSADRSAISSNGALTVIAYDSDAKSENEAASWGKAVFTLKDASPSEREARSGRLAYASVIGIEKSASFEAPLHRIAIRALIETLISAGVEDVDDLQTRCSVAFPSDTEEFRDTEIALVQSGQAATRTERKKVEQPQKPSSSSSSSSSRRERARSIEDEHALAEGSTDGDEDEEEEEEETTRKPERRRDEREKAPKPSKDAIASSSSSSSSSSSHEEASVERLVRGALSELESVVRDAPSDGRRTGPSSESFSQTVKLRPKSPVPLMARPRSVRDRKGDADAVATSEPQIRWPSDFLRPEAEIFADAPQVDISFEPEHNVPDLFSLDSLGEYRSPIIQLIDSFCSRVGVFTTNETRIPYFGITSREGMRVLMELRYFDKKQPKKLCIGRPQKARYGEAFANSDVTMAETTSIKGLTVLPEQALCICIASHPQFASCELGAGASRARTLLLELVASSRDSGIDDHYIGPGYEAQLRELESMLREHRAYAWKSPRARKAGYRIAILNKVWSRKKLEEKCAELERCIAAVFAVVCTDEDGVEYPIICRTSNFDLTKAGPLVTAAEARNPRLRDLISTCEKGEGRWNAEVNDVISLTETEDVCRVAPKTKTHPSVEIHAVKIPHRRTAPIYFYGLTRFQKEVLLGTANKEIANAYVTLRNKKRAAN